MSPSTAPASTDGSWSLSPSSTRRQSGGSAATSAFMRCTSTIDDSSTTTSFSGSLFSLVCLQFGGRPPSSEWIVMPFSAPICARTSSGMPSAFAHCSRNASPMRCAARPVGAASAMSSAAKPLAISARRTAHTIVVLPVPGPPVTTVNIRSAAVLTALTWSSFSLNPLNAQAADSSSFESGATSGRLAASDASPAETASTADAFFLKNQRGPPASLRLTTISAHNELAARTASGHAERTSTPNASFVYDSSAPRSRYPPFSKSAGPFSGRRNVLPSRKERNIAAKNR